MKSFEIRAFGHGGLELSEKSDPKPGLHDVLVRLSAASLNYRDLLILKGTYDPKLKLPLVPVSDGAGIVVETGAHVSRFRVGDRVLPCFFQKWFEGPPQQGMGSFALGGSIDGVLREYAAFHEDGLVHTPASLTDLEAATLPCAALTAWHALYEQSGAVPGQTVLLEGTGGVSIFALQFAKAGGLRTIVTSSSQAKMERVRALGANETINYREQPDWDKQVLQLTDGAGVDNVIEVGGQDTFPKALRAVRTNGAVSLIGTLSGGGAALSPRATMNSLKLNGIFVGSRVMFERMNRAIEMHGIKPVLDRTFPWSECADALRYMETQNHIGKICLSF